MDAGRKYILFIVLLAEIKQSLCQENVAVLKPAEQCGVDFRGNASLAVDGNVDDNFYHGSCSHTYEASNTWWKVDLLGYYTIISVKIYNRAESETGRLQEFEVRVSTTNPTVFPSREGNLCQYRSAQVTPGGEMLYCSQPVTGRYVSIYKAANSHLTLCEVQVYADETKYFQRDAVFQTISPNTRCNTTIVMTTTTRSTLHCAIMCQRESQCVSFNVQRLPGNQDSRVCELLSYAAFIPFTDPPLDYEGWQCYYSLH